MSLQLLSADDFSFRVQRSARRRTVGIHIRDAEVIVRAPPDVPEHTLQQLVYRKRAWIRNKLAAQRHQLASIPEHSYLDGSTLPWLGRSLNLIVRYGSTINVHLDGAELCVTLSRRSSRPSTEQTRALVGAWYRTQAHGLLSAKSRALAERLGLHCRDVKVRITRSKWGHCTSAGVLQYNWHIVLAPEPVLDYLVAHEVCHLRHMNHSTDFWALVASVCPDYQIHRNWLKANGRSLVL